MQADVLPAANKLQFYLPGSSALDEFPAEHTVFRSSSKSLSWAAFRHSVASWMTALELHCPHAETVGIYHQDSAEFAAILLAVWRLGRQAIVVPNTLSPTLEKLSGLAEQWAGQFPEKNRVNCCKSSNAVDPDAVVDRLLSGSLFTGGSEIVLRLFTSGSSGEPTLVDKTFRQIHAEADMLQAVWGDSVQGLQSISSVSHHHMYGLSFHIFWPLLFGRTVFSEELPYLEALPDALNSSPSVLIASPAHLATLPASVDWASCRELLGLVFSAGAPLSETAVDNCKSKLGFWPLEIYGSTEAGAVAWRQLRRDTVWQALPGVSCRIEQQCLSLQSPALVDERWEKTADQVELHSNQRFSLLGRMDKIVKLAGKRISLNAVERQLGQHEWVERSRVLPHPKKPDRLCAVVELRPAGLAALIDIGTLALQRQLKRALQGQMESVAFPRYWRFVNAMPMNTQGKISSDELYALFDKDNLVESAELISSEFAADSNSLSCTIRIPFNLKYLQGHFPGQPVLAGVVQIHWAQEFAQQQFGLEKDKFAGMEAVKFQRVILPGTLLRLELRYESASRKLHFKYCDSVHTYSQGRIVFSGA